MSRITMTTRSSDGFLEFRFDDQLLMTIENQLGSLKGQSRKILKTAVNQTAKQARERLANKTKETYVVQKKRVTKAMELEKATSANPQATIKIQGEQMELKEFKTSPASYKAGARRPSVTKAKVLLSSSLKPLNLSGRKAFLAKFQSGHVSVVQRRGKARFPLKKLLSNSIPKMVGQDGVLGTIEPEIYDDLMRNIHQQMERVMSK